MYQRVIVATDVSAASDAVVRSLSCLKHLGARECLLLQCLVLPDGLPSGMAVVSEQIEGMLNVQKAMAEKEGFAVTSRIVVGSPKHEIVRIAKEENYHLIVLGTQGRSLAEEKLLGGVAYGVISRSTKPVMVIPIEKRNEQVFTCDVVGRCELTNHILFATDLSEIADHAFAHLERLTVEQGVRNVTLLHNQDQVKIERYLQDLNEEFNQLDRERLEKLKKKLLKAGAKQANIEITHGVAAQEILAAVERNNASLLMMGTQGRGFLGEILLGSVSHSVVRKSKVPVLLIPRSASV